jgi:hypothetical protein
MAIVASASTHISQNLNINAHSASLSRTPALWRPCRGLQCRSVLLYRFQDASISEVRPDGSTPRSRIDRKLALLLQG